MVEGSTTMYSDGIGPRVIKLGVRQVEEEVDSADLRQLNARWLNNKEVILK
jgi:hypothetical protein